jgi:Lrp/AsnC family transcriptional regulator, regulator for asnA, asnC and gidA
VPTTTILTAAEPTADLRREKRFTVAQCVADCYESAGLRSPDAQPLRLAPGAGRGAVTPAQRVDELDRKIIEALQENGRESFRRIAARLGVSEGTIRARYARLTSEGILQVVAVTNPLGLGFDQALVGLKTSGAPGDIADEIARWPEADYVVVTAGQFDLVVEVVAADRHELLELTNRMRALPGVATTETFFYLEMWKQLYDWGTRR